MTRLAEHTRRPGSRGAGSPVGGESTPDVFRSFAKEDEAFASPELPDEEFDTAGADAFMGATASSALNLAAMKQGLHAKLEIGSSDDPLEKEADRMAEAVTSETPSDGSSGAAEEPEPIRMKGEGGASGGATASGAQAASIGAALASGGILLPPATRKSFESKMGADFSGVRVHTGEKAAESAESINAKAYTAGDDIVFAKNQYAPESLERGKLLAHELVHATQRSAIIQRTSAGDETESSPYWRPGSQQQSQSICSPQTSKDLEELPSFFFSGGAPIQERLTQYRIHWVYWFLVWKPQLEDLGRRSHSSELAAQVIQFERDVLGSSYNRNYPNLRAVTPEEKERKKEWAQVNRTSEDKLRSGIRSLLEVLPADEKKKQRKNAETLMNRFFASGDLSCGTIPAIILQIYKTKEGVRTHDSMRVATNPPMEWPVSWHSENYSADVLEQAGRFIIKYIDMKIPVVARVVTYHGILGELYLLKFDRRRKKKKLTLPRHSLLITGYRLDRGTREKPELVPPINSCPWSEPAIG